MPPPPTIDIPCTVQLLLGRPTRSRLDLLCPHLAVKVRGRQEKQNEAHDIHSSDRDLAIGDLETWSMPATLDVKPPGCQDVL